ncbi:hypothetical protein FRC17_006601 [Serendipita sp. 399]|nr:hypothetical protein FRC17_006601 [Serendipita sp. 399]
MAEKTSIVILGAGGAGVAISAALDKKLDPSKHTVTLVSSTDYYRHHPAALRAVVTSEGHFENQMLIPFDTMFGRGYKDGKGRLSSLKIGHVVRIEELDDGKHGYVVFDGGERLNWDILVIATGSDWNGPLRDWPNRLSEIPKFMEGWREKFATARSVVIAGSGAVGSELAGEIRDFHPSVEVTVVHKQHLLLNSTYPDAYRQRITDDLKARNIRVLTEDSVNNLTSSILDGTDAVEPGRTITTAKGVQVPAELIIATVGRRGVNTHFVHASSAPTISKALKPGGHLDVKDTLQLTTNPNVFAAGDVVALAEQHTLIKAGSHAGIVTGNILSLLRTPTGPLKNYTKATDMILITNGRKGIQVAARSLADPNLLASRVWHEMAAVQRPLLNNERPSTSPVVREINNFDVKFASLRNVDLLNIAAAGMKPPTGLNKGHIRAIVRVKRESKMKNGNWSLALLLTSAPSQKRNMMFSSQDARPTQESKRLECIVPGNTKQRLPDVGDTIELALNSPTILDCTNAACFPFKLKFDTLIMRVVSTSSQETDLISPQNSQGNSQDPSVASKEMKGNTSVPPISEDTTMSSVETKRPPPLLAAAGNSISPDIRTGQQNPSNIKKSLSSLRPGYIPPDVSTAMPLQKEQTKKSPTKKGNAKKMRHQREKDVEEALRIHRKLQLLEIQKRASHQRETENVKDPSNSVFPPVADNVFTKNKMVKRVVKAISKSLSSTDVLDPSQDNSYDAKRRVGTNDDDLDMVVETAQKMDDPIEEWEDEPSKANHTTHINDYNAVPAEFDKAPDDISMPKRAKMNLIVVIQAQGDLRLSKGGDCWMRSYNVFDHSIGPAEVVKINLFFKKESWVPDLMKDQLILLRNIEVDEFNHRKTLTGRNGTFSWIAYDPESNKSFFNTLPLADRPGAPATELCEQETEYICSLIKWQQKKREQHAGFRPASPIKRKHKLLSEWSIQHQFIDATVQLLSKNISDRYISLAITDYTKNDDFKDFVSAAAPGRQMTLDLYVYSNEDAFDTAKMLKVGSYYRIKNMKRAIYEGQMQAKMGLHGGFTPCSEQDVDGDPDLKRLLDRKAEFELQNKLVNIEVDLPNDILYGNPRHSAATFMSDEPISVPGPTTSQRLVCNSKAPLRSYSQLAQISRPVESRIRGRIVEFLPRNLNDAVVIFCNGCRSYRRGPDLRQFECPSCRSSTNCAYQLQFVMLVLNEVDDCIDVKVAGEEGLKLFGLTAADFEKEAPDFSSIVRQVEAKLGTIFGNLTKLIEEKHPLLQEERSSHLGSTSGYEVGSFGMKKGSGE